MVYFIYQNLILIMWFAFVTNKTTSVSMKLRQFVLRYISLSSLQSNTTRKSTNLYIVMLENYHICKYNNTTTVECPGIHTCTHIIIQPADTITYQVQHQ